MTGAGGDARTVAQARRALFSARQAVLIRRDRQLSLARGLVFAIGVLAWYLAAGRDLLPAWAVAAVFAFFAILVAAHARVDSAHRHASRGTAFYDRVLARLGGRWQGLGHADVGAVDEGHPFAADLDLFGAGSLFERLDATRSAAGAHTLAGWLLAPAGPAEVRERQEAVEELRGHVQLREDLALAGDHAGEGRGLRAVAEWAGSGGTLPAWTAPVAAALGAANVAALVALLAEWAGPEPLLLSGFSSAALALLLRRRVHRVLAGLDAAAREMTLVAALAARLQEEAFTAARLVALGTPGAAASMRQLVRLADLLDAMRNMMFAPVGALLLWRIQVAAAVGRWRMRHGKSVPSWTRSVGEAEALLSLSAYAWERPHDPFPALAADGPLFDGEAVAHPLLHDDVAVANDARMDAAQPLLVVSGSNMSGKSTLLRAVGANTVLAFAGAPVRARRLAVSPLAIGASLRVQDSLMAGRSRFMAEIERIKLILDLAARGPALFLLDEVLQGTNSADRRTGAEALLRRLVERGAIGLVTTHDLALADIADALAPRARNVHFEDLLEEGGLGFDYRLREGVVRRGNALALMRSVGLEV